MDITHAISMSMSQDDRNKMSFSQLLDDTTNSSSFLPEEFEKHSKTIDEELVRLAEYTRYIRALAGLKKPQNMSEPDPAHTLFGESQNIARESVLFTETPRTEQGDPHGLNPVLLHAINTTAVHEYKDSPEHLDHMKNITAMRLSMTATPYSDETYQDDLDRNKNDIRALIDPMLDKDFISVLDYCATHDARALTDTAKNTLSGYVPEHTDDLSAPPPSNDHG